MPWLMKKNSELNAGAFLV